MSKIVYTDEAKQDLYHIQVYCMTELHQSKKSTDKMIVDILDSIRHLKMFPRMGAVLQTEGRIAEEIRFLVKSEYMIFYFLNEPKGEVVIVRVINGRRDYLKLLFGS